MRGVVYSLWSTSWYWINMIRLSWRTVLFVTYILKFEFCVAFFLFDGKSRHYHDKFSTLAIRKIWDYFCTVNSRHHELIIDLLDIMIALLLLLVLLLSTKTSRTIVILYNSVAVCKILTLNSQMSFIKLSILSLLCMCITAKLNGSLYI